MDAAILPVRVGVAQRASPADGMPSFRLACVLPEVRSGGSMYGTSDNVMDAEPLESDSKTG